jgi:hypothetical protein
LEPLLVVGGDGEHDGHRLIDGGLVDEAVEVLALQELGLAHKP